MPPDREYRRVLNQRILTAEDAVRLLWDTRRTLLKLVANIDEAIDTVNRPSRSQQEEGERVTRSLH